MSEETNKPNQKDASVGNYVKTFRRGAIAANVFRRTSQKGAEYMNFSISRAWKTKAGNEGYSQNLFADNRDAVIAVVHEACDFIAAETEAPSRVDSEAQTAHENDSA